MEAERFVDLMYDSVGRPIDVRFLYGGRVVEVVTDRNYTLRFARRGLTQFLHAMGYTRRDLKRLKPEDVLKRWDSIPINTILSAFKDIVDGNRVYVIYRVTSDEYVPIPHRVLFQHVDSILRDAGFNTNYEVVKYYTRTGARWLLWETPLKYAREGDAFRMYLYVTNANTGNDSIKLFGYGQILLCKNGLVTENTISRVRVYHVRDVKTVLARVTKALKEVLDKMTITNNEVVQAIERLQTIELTDDQLREWQRKLYEMLPRKYHALLATHWTRNIEVFGGTAEAVFQTMTALNSRIKNYRLHQQLNRQINELLAVAMVPTKR